MLTTTTKRTIAAALSGAAIAGAIGAPAASAMPIDPVGAPGVWIVPSLRSAAISRYDDLEANKAKSMQALGLAMMQQSCASPYRDVEADEARTAQAR
jgi:hypothetical protein